MTLLDRFRWWCAWKLIEEERLRCAGIVLQHGEECKAVLIMQTQKIWQQGYEQGQRDLLDSCLQERNGKELVN